MTVDDILPCSACGGKPTAVLDDYIRGKIIDDPDFIIECENSGCNSSFKVTGKYRDFDHLVTLWNIYALNMQNAVEIVAETLYDNNAMFFPWENLSTQSHELFYTKARALINRITPFIKV